jgi:hypothetical protein
MTRIAPLALAALAFASGCAGPPGRPTPQRPTFSRNTSTTAAGTTELEAGVLYEPGDYFDSPVTLKYGIQEETELFATMGAFQWRDTPGSDGEGIGDLFVGVRQRFIDVGADEPMVAYQLKTKLPTADENEALGTGQLDFFAAGILDYPIEQLWLTTFYELGVLGDPANGDPDIQHGLAFASHFPIEEELGGYGELAGVFIPEHDEEKVFADAGLTYALTDGIVLDAGVAVGLSGDAANLQVLFGITTNFGGGTAQPSRREGVLPPAPTFD